LSELSPYGSGDHDSVAYGAVPPLEVVTHSPRASRADAVDQGSGHEDVSIRSRASSVVARVSVRFRKEWRTWLTEGDSEKLKL